MHTCADDASTAITWAVLRSKLLKDYYQKRTETSLCKVSKKKSSPCRDGSMLDFFYKLFLCRLLNYDSFSLKFLSRFHFLPRAQKCCTQWGWKSTHRKWRSTQAKRRWMPYFLFRYMCITDYLNYLQSLGTMMSTWNCLIWYYVIDIIMLIWYYAGMILCCYKNAWFQLINLIFQTLVVILYSCTQYTNSQILFTLHSHTK